MNKENYVWFEYIFNFNDRDDMDRDDMTFTVYLDKNTNVAIPPEASKNYEWTKLDFCKCDICPLDSERVKYCPIAYNISGLADRFSEIFSTEKVQITVKVKERTYIKTDTVQQGLRSILGIYLATSGCPHMQILKPMARFHLPFATIEETIYRHVGNYLISQYYRHIKGEKPDMNLDEFITKNEMVDKVNHGMCKRIESITEGDANKNALIILNTIGLMLDIELKSQLDSLKYLFDGDM